MNDLIKKASEFSMSNLEISIHNLEYPQEYGPEANPDFRLKAATVAVRLVEALQIPVGSFARRLETFEGAITPFPVSCGESVSEATTKPQEQE